MGLKRFLWRSTKVGSMIDTTKNIIEEGSIIKGYKRTIKENLTEDNPITKPIYEIGKYDGKIAGYEAASTVYEKKLLEQADKILTQKKIFEEERESYEKLLDEYEFEINKLSKKLDKSKVEIAFLRELLIRERGLKQMMG